MPSYIAPKPIVTNKATFTKKCSNYPCTKCYQLDKCAHAFYVMPEAKGMPVAACKFMDEFLPEENRVEPGQCVWGYRECPSTMEDPCPA
jgi:hypothetical protein